MSYPVSRLVYLFSLTVSFSGVSNKHSNGFLLENQNCQKRYPSLCQEGWLKKLVGRWPEGKRADWKGGTRGPRLGFRENILISILEICVFWRERRAGRRNPRAVVMRHTCVEACVTLWGPMTVSHTEWEWHLLLCGPGCWWLQGTHAPWQRGGFTHAHLGPKVLWDVNWSHPRGWDRKQWKPWGKIPRNNQRKGRFFKGIREPRNSEIGQDMCCTWSFYCW